MRTQHSANSSRCHAPYQWKLQCIGSKLVSGAPSLPSNSPPPCIHWSYWCVFPKCDHVKGIPLINTLATNKMCWQHCTIESLCSCLIHSHPLFLSANVFDPPSINLMVVTNIKGNHPGWTKLTTSNRCSLRQHNGVRDSPTSVVLSTLFAWVVIMLMVSQKVSNNPGHGKIMNPTSETACDQD